MKKLLVLALVLVLASLSSASIVGSVALVGNTVTVTGTVDAGTYLAIVCTPGGTLSSFALGGTVLATLESSGFAYDAQVLNVDISAFPEDMTGQWWTLTSTSIVNYPFTAPLLSANIALTGASSTIQVWQFDEMVGEGVQIGEDISVVVPEPMTMGLLALGGLFIRRKK
ncbi:MAG: PEP-CTERM sorting domain-containing protein [Phycisphaerae bacterium]|nr:PEP-CTERM sorting domain-containing protein [Phycisphaerae bacterium]